MRPTTGVLSLLPRLAKGQTRLLCVVLLLLATSLLLTGQDAGGGAGGGSASGGSGSTGGTGGTGGSAGTGTTGGTGSTGGAQPGSGGQGTVTGGGQGGAFGGSQPMDTSTSRALYISGKVVLQEGGPAPTETVIELVCNGQSLPEGRVNSKGDFSIRVGRDTNLIADASATSLTGRTRGGFQSGSMGIGGGSRITESGLAGCDIRASLPGFRSTSINLLTRRIPNRPDIGTLVLTRLAKVEGLTISATTLSAPKAAAKAYEKGLQELRNGKFRKAIPHLEKAVAEYPRYAVAWYALGSAREGVHDDAQAEAHYHKALEADNRYVPPYLRLASLAASVQRWDRAEAYSATVIRLNPYDFPHAFYLNALSNLQLEQYERAEESAREAKKMDPSNRMERLDYFLALILAIRGKYSEAATFMKAYIQGLPPGADTAALQQQLVEMEQQALVRAQAQDN